jgi:hypothetical protein
MEVPVKSGPKLIVNEPYNGFEVQPITTVAPSVFHPPGAGVLQAVKVSGQATGVGQPEPSSIRSVTVQVDDGPLIVTLLTPVKDAELPTVNFSASVGVADVQGPHVITVTATDDRKQYVTQSVTVFVGPPFQIAPASALIEVNALFIKKSTDPPYPAQPELDGYSGDIQPHLTSLATLLAKYGLTLAGPSITLDPVRQVLRIGLWVGDQDFAAVAASPGTGSPLPTLSDVQAAFCFTATPPLLPVGTVNCAVAIPTATLQQLATAVSPAVSQATARHHLALGSLTVAPDPPSKVVVTLKGTLTAVVPVTVTATATLGTVLLPMSVFPSQKGLEITGISVSSSTGSVLDWLADSLLPLIEDWILPYEAIKVSSDASGDAADYTATANEVLAALPYEVPFRNTAFSASDHLSEDFPVVNVGWTVFGSTDAGIVAGCDLSLADRTQSDVLLDVRAETTISATEAQTAGQVNAQYSFRLQNIAPDPFTWTLSLAGVTQAEDSIAAGSFTQSGGFTVPIRLPLQPGLTISVNGSETCGSDPAMVLTAYWSELVTAAAPPVPPTPGKPPHQPP